MRSEDSDAKALLSPENRERFGIHYLGLSLILAWYYCLWFSPSMFSTLPITDDAVTFSWLSTLALTGSHSSRHPSSLPRFISTSSPSSCGSLQQPPV